MRSRAIVQTTERHAPEPPWEGFETYKEAAAEDRQRLAQIGWHPRGPLTSAADVDPRLRAAIRTLANRSVHCLKRTLLLSLEDKIYAHLEGQDVPPTLASSVSTREARVEVILKTLRAFEPFDDAELSVVTVIKRRWSLSPSEFDRTRAASLRNQFRRDLWRIGVLDIPEPFIGFIHGEYDPTGDLFVLHFHVLTTARKAQAMGRLEALRGYQKTHTGAVPILVQPVRDRPRQVSYLLKSFWQQRAFRPETGKRDRRGTRITEPHHTRYLLWLDRERLGDLTLMNNCWSLKRGGSPAMKQLYLSIYPNWGKKPRK